MTDSSGGIGASVGRTRKSVKLAICLTAAPQLACCAARAEWGANDKGARPPGAAPREVELIPSSFRYFRLPFALMLVEILHIVHASIRTGVLRCEPFLIVALIARIRRIEATRSHTFSDGGLSVMPSRQTLRANAQPRSPQTRGAS